jgi:ceramide glucosyltransferase
VSPWYALAFLHWMVCMTGTASAIILAVVGLWSRPRRGSFDPAAPTPPITIIKPFDGTEPHLAENFEATLAVDYPAPRQVLFCTDRSNAEGIALVERLIARWHGREGDVSVELLLSRPGESPPTNRKIWHLQRGVDAACHNVIVCADSSTTLEGDVLVALVGALEAEPGRGLTWAISTSKGRGGLGARLTRVAFAGSALNFGLVAATHRLLRRPPFVTGALLAIRRSALASLGGFAPYADVLAEDIAIGRDLARAGWAVELSSQPVYQRPGDDSLRALYGRLLRWNVAMWRARDPLRVHYPLVVCPLAWLPLSWPLALASHPEWAQSLSVIALVLVVTRWLFALIVLGVVTGQRLTIDVLWAPFLVEPMMLAAYVHGRFTRSVRWRGQELRVGRDGRIHRGNGGGASP